MTGSKEALRLIVAGGTSFVGYHGHMPRATRGSPEEQGTDAFDATEPIRAARRGFRRDVAALIEALKGARFLVPLSKSIAEVPLGIEQEADELSLSPHLLYDDERIGFVPVFTNAALLERATEQTGWGTGDGPLEYVTLPGAAILELALAIVDDDAVEGLLVNPFDDSELVLQRHELASIAQGRPLPLVGYVSEIPFGDDEKRLVAEMEGPPPEDLVEAITRVLGGEKDRSLRFELTRTFNPERDLEPHLTLTITGPAEMEMQERSQIAGRLSEAVEGLLPPPGYIDILFDES
jgi:hypothetical protein